MARMLHQRPTTVTTATAAVPPAPVAPVLRAAPTAPAVVVAPGVAPPAVVKAPAAWWRRAWVLIAVSLALVAIVATVLALVLRRPAAASFRTVQVVRADVVARVTATGTVQPIVTSPVGAQVSGIVWKLHADFNSRALAGQLLVELDPALFQNAVALATAQLAAARANLSGTSATREGARVVRNRTRTLEQQRLVSTSDLDASQALYGSSSGLASANVAQVALARAQLDKARLDLAHSIIRAPVEGTVIARNVDIGQAVAATLTAPTLFTIASDMRHMQVHAAVDEADIGDVHPGQNASFTVDAFRDDRFGAVVNQVRNAPQTLSNVVTYDVVLDVENPDLKLRPGMTANVLILVARKQQVAAVPNEALRFRPVAPPLAPGAARPAVAEGRAGAAVYVARGAVAERVPVKLGISDGNLTEVEGLEPGREVIVDVLRGKARAAAPAGGPSRGP